MDRIQITFRVDDEVAESVGVESLGGGLFRLADTPMMANTEDDPLWAGDVIEAELLPDDTHRLVRVVERSPMRHFSWCVPSFFAGSAEHARFGAAVVAAGGWWESALGGLLWAHVPSTSSFDPVEELSQRIAAARHEQPEA